MSVLNQSGEEQVECPLCMEPLEVDDINFFPCTCGYQICRFCWHRIRTDENGLCPACRKAYPENPADFKPLTQEEVQKLKAEKRQRDQQRKQKITENRKHLANVRVVQKNLVFVVGLPMRLADAEILKKHEYFGKFGKIHKVVINQSTSYAGSQGPSASAYVTYHKADDALRAIQAVNNISVDGRTIKTSLGTTKYCSHFMKNQPCPKPDCMYLHDLGDPEASFTKEEMQQGKHQEYEKKLHEQLLNGYNKDRKPGSSPPRSTQSSVCASANSAVSSGSASTSSQSQMSKQGWQHGSANVAGNKSPISSVSSGCSNSVGRPSGSGNQRRSKDSHKKRHALPDDKGRLRDKLQNSTGEDRQSKMNRSKMNLSNSERPTSGLSKDPSRKLSVNFNRSCRSRSKDRNSGGVSYCSVSDVPSNMPAGRFHKNSGRLPAVRAAALLEQDNNSFFSSNTFTKVSTTVSGTELC